MRHLTRRPALVGLACLLSVGALACAGAGPPAPGRAPPDLCRGILTDVWGILAYLVGIRAYLGGSLLI